LQGIVVLVHNASKLNLIWVVVIQTYVARISLDDEGRYRRLYWVKEEEGGFTWHGIANHITRVPENHPSEVTLPRIGISESNNTTEDIIVSGINSEYIVRDLADIAVSQ
jgi:hypothetical protein